MNHAWQSEAEDIGGEVKARPYWTGDGIPRCSRGRCPRWIDGYGGGCDTLFEVNDVCTPVVAQMARALMVVKL